MCYAFQTIHAYENAKFTDNSNKIRPYFEHDSTTQREKEQNKKILHYLVTTYHHFYFPFLPYPFINPSL